MISHCAARALAQGLAAAASRDDAAAWEAGVESLAGLDGAAWLVLDQAARTARHPDGSAPVSRNGRWMRAALNEPSGFVAAVASLHVDGRVRERAVHVLATAPRAVAVPALAVRLLDHVPEVRARAWEALPHPRRLEDAEALLDVLLAGADRQHAADALTRVEVAVVDTDPALLPELLASGRRRVRRWAFHVGHDRGLLTTGVLLSAALADPDQWLQARCAQWLSERDEPGVLTGLLGARSVEARLIALDRVPDRDLGDDALRVALVDPAPRVREVARSRARLRGWDVADHYRRRLDEHTSPRMAAACLDGLALTGNEADLRAAVARLRHPSPRVRAAAVTAVHARAAHDDAAERLAPMLLDPSTRICSAAARALARLGAPPATAEPAWASDQVWSRRSGWRVHRAPGGWHRVEADLRAAADPDQALATLGRFGISTWLEVSAARTWAPLADDQRARIAALLDRAGLDGPTRRSVAFHAGVDVVDQDGAPGGGEVSAGSPAGRGRGWLRLVRGG
ncbi:HEAT repeat domain-containing protein [Cellulomonas sp. NPDC058312]|uniref:HEAT repeat domain-containing protein n=1 Tax=Cellulomonas sp. NPDC058312 TaxID=3346441 RepID=UPI0036EFC022